MDKNIAKAIFAAQEDMPELVKDSSNPHFKNTYISLDAVLEAVLPPLRKNGLMLTQAPDVASGVPVLTTRITHVDSGEELVGQHPLIMERESPQAVGSAITYARRYALLSMLGLTADEDDDGEAASEPSARKAEASGTEKPKKKPAF